MAFKLCLPPSQLTPWQGHCHPQVLRPSCSVPMGCLQGIHCSGDSSQWVPLLADMPLWTLLCAFHQLRPLFLVFSVLLLQPRVPAHLSTRAQQVRQVLSEGSYWAQDIALGSSELWQTAFQKVCPLSMKSPHPARASVLHGGGCRTP